MSRSSSDEQSRAIDDELPEDTVFHTTESLQAEIAWRQERIRRDFRRAGWFSRLRRPAEPDQLRTAVRARHAAHPTA